MRSADLVFLNGNIVTGARSSVPAVAVRDGVLVALGPNDVVQQWASAGTTTVDLAGKTLLPAFIDAHTHVASIGLRKTLYLDLSDARSLAETLERVRAETRSRQRGAWLLGRGWDESRWPERRYIARSELDRVAPDNPVALIRVDGHMLVANSLALETVAIPRGSEEYDETSGQLREETAAAFLQQLQPGLDEIKEGILAAARSYHQLGVTAVHDIVRPVHIRAYLDLWRGGQLNLRVRMNPSISATDPQLLNHLVECGLSGEFGNERLTLGAVKFFADGSIGAGNAALAEPYVDRTGRGKLNWPQEQLIAALRKVRQNKFQIMIHAIGDRAIEAALDALEAAQVTREERPRLEHFELPTARQLARACGLGLVASMQPNFLQWSGPGGLYETRLGTARDRRIDPHRHVREAGLTLAFGSDGMPPGPLLGIHYAVNAPHEAQKTSMAEAIECYTAAAAYAGFQERSLGSIDLGKRADLVVLSDDPRQSPRSIRDIKPEMVFLDGERVV